MKPKCGWSRFITIFLLTGAGIFACQRDTSEQPSPSPLIVVANLQRHPILDAVEKGTVDALAQAGYQDGKTAQLVFRNAGGDMQRIGTIAQEIAAQKPAVTIAISTPVAQAIVQRAQGPVVFGALTDPVGAGVVSSLSGAAQITGSSDALPYEAQLKLVRRILPSARRLGLLYNPGEAASQYALGEIRRVAPNLGFELVEGPVATTNEVYPVAAGLAPRVDFLLISTDNTVAAGIAGAVKIATERKLPLFACDSGSVEKGAIGAVSPGYYEIGRETGRLAARLLAGERNIPVVLPSGGEIYLNVEAARRMGVPIPKEVAREATKTFESISG